MKNPWGVLTSVDIYKSDPDIITDAKKMKIFISIVRSYRYEIFWGVPGSPFWQRQKGLMIFNDPAH